MEAGSVLPERGHRQGKKLQLRNLSDGSHHKRIQADSGSNVDRREPTVTRATATQPWLWGSARAVLLV